MATEYKLSYTASTINEKLGKIDSLAEKSEIPTKTSELTNDSGYITSYTETDPTVPAWAKASAKPTYTKSEVGLGNVDNVKQYSANNPPPYPVTKVNNKTGAVTLTASDVGADASGTASSAVSTHNSDVTAHADIREEISQISSEKEAIKTSVKSLQERIDNIDSDVAYVKSVNGILPDETGNVAITVTAQQPEFVVKNTVEEALEWLRENGDKSKVYVLPDGYIYKYMTSTITYDKPNCNNLFTNKNLLVGYRLSSANLIKTSDNTTLTTDVIPVNAGETYVIRGYNCSGIATLIEYSDIPTFVVGQAPTNFVAKVDGSNNKQWEAPGALTHRFDHTMSSNTKYISFSLYTIDEAQLAEVIITLNEPVVLGTTPTTEVVTDWTNTMQSYNSTDYEDRIIALEESSTEYDSRLKALENDTSYIPSYWQSHLNEKVPLIRETMATVGKNKSAFFFYSDAHWTGNSKNSPMLLKYLYKYTPINKTNYGGDIVGTESYEAEDMAYLYDSWRSAIRDLPNHHSVAGNHDDRNESGHDHGFSKEYVYSFLLAPEETNDRVDGAELYYYIDDKCENTRYLYLDTACYDGYRLSDHQAQFVIDSLESAPANYHIVVIAHAWYNQNYDNYPAVTASGLTTTTTKLLELFNAYNTKASGVLTELTNSSTQANNATVNYNFTNASGKVEFCIGGHLHNDYNETFYGIPVILCEADTMNNRNGSVSKNGTITEQCITAVIADYKNAKINLIRIGRGNDFVIDMNSGESIKYHSVTYNLTNVTSSNTATSMEANGIYNTTLTATSGTLTSVVVTMGGTDVTSSVYDESTGVITISAVTGNIAITAVATSDESSETTSYTNLLPLALAADGTSIYNGKGWKENTRWSGSSNADSTAEGIYITGYIPASPKDIIYLKNITMPTGTGNNSVVHFFKALDDTNEANMNGNMLDTYNQAVRDSNGNLIQFTVGDGDYQYIRVQCGGMSEASIITKNEPID